MEESGTTIEHLWIMGGILYCFYFPHRDQNYSPNTQSIDRTIRKVQPICTARVSLDYAGYR